MLGVGPISLQLSETLRSTIVELGIEIGTIRTEVLFGLIGPWARKQLRLTTGGMHSFECWRRGISHCG